MPHPSARKRGHGSRVPQGDFILQQAFVVQATQLPGVFQSLRSFASALVCGWEPKAIVKSALRGLKRRAVA
jgi:hypothetical protein